MIETINTELAPAAIGPYSQAVWAGNLLFTSGSIALDKEGYLQNDTLEQEVHTIMNNLKMVLAAAGLGFANVAKTTIFLTDISRFASVNQIYGSYFPDKIYPARETVEVSALPRGVSVEISMVAVRPRA